MSWTVSPEEKRFPNRPSCPAIQGANITICDSHSPSMVSFHNIWAARRSWENTETSSPYNIPGTRTLLWAAGCSRYTNTLLRAQSMPTRWQRIPSIRSMTIFLDNLRDSDFPKKMQQPQQCWSAQIIIYKLTLITPYLWFLFCIYLSILLINHWYQQFYQYHYFVFNNSLILLFVVTSALHLSFSPE